MENKRRILAWILSLALILGMLPGLPAAALAAESEQTGAAQDQNPVESTGTADPDSTEESTTPSDPTPIEKSTGSDAPAPSEEPADKDGPAPSAESAGTDGSDPTEESAGTDEPDPTEESAGTDEPDPTEESTDSVATDPTKESTAPEETDPTEESTTPTEPEITLSTATVVPDAVGLPSDEELFALYANSVFYGDVSAYGSYAGNRLTGDVKLAYDALVPLIQAIASGRRSSTVITVGEGDGVDATVDFTEENAFSEESGGLSKLLDALLADMPYELYWYDKTAKTPAGMSITNGYLSELTLSFPVTGSYGGSEAYTVNTEKTRAAFNAAANSASVISAASGKSDYEKLVYFRDWICKAVSYDSSAASNGSFSVDGNPWQMIYVFDGDSSTNVVCEGYSKAFQYLCDLAGLTCYSVTGTMDGGTGAGNHMWNIVTLGGQNYLVDVTNSDTGTVGADGSLFLAGGTPDSDGSYTFNGVKFTYDAETQSLYGTEILTLATASYVPNAASTDSGTETTYEELFRAAVAEAAANGTAVELSESVTLTSDLTVSSLGTNDQGEANTLLISANGELIVPNGVTLTLDAHTQIVGGKLIVQEGGTLIAQDIDVDGGGLLLVQGSMTKHGATFIVNNGVIDIRGTLTNDGPLHVGYAGNGTLDISGKVINSNYVNLCETGSIFLYGTLINEGNGGTDAYLDLHGNLQINGTLDNDALLSNDGDIYVAQGGLLDIGPECEAIVAGSAYVDVRGTLKVDGALAVNDEASVWMNGGEAIINGEANVLCNFHAGFMEGAGTITVNGTLNILADENGNGYVPVGPGSTLHVTSTGTVNNGGYIDHGEGTIQVDAGGTLNNNFLFSIDGGTVTINGTFTQGESADLVNLYDSGDGPATITGIDKSDIRYRVLITSEEDLIGHLLDMEGYAEKALSLSQSMTLTQTVTIPTDFDGIIRPSYEDIKLIVGSTGNLSGLGSLIVECPVEIQSGGFVMCEGTMSFNADVTIDGGMASTGNMVLNGTVTNNGVLHAGFTGENNTSVPGSLDVNGTVTNNSYLAVHEGATLNINTGASLVNPVKTDANYPFIENAGIINVYGELTNNYQLSLGNQEGTGNAVVNVNAGGTLTNNHILDVCGGGTVVENGGTYNQNGVYVYDAVSSIEAAMLNGVDTWELPGDLVIDRELAIPSGTTLTITNAQGNAYTLTIASTGTITVEDGATLNLDCPVEIQTGGSIVYESVTSALDTIIANESASEEEIVNSVQAIDTQELATAMANDPATVEKIAALAGKVTSVTATVNVDNAPEKLTGVKVIGAVLNAAEGSTNVETLVEAASNNNFVNFQLYDEVTAVTYSMTQTGVTNASNLSVPVKIELDVPEGFNTTKLVVLHHHDDTTEVVEPLTFSEDGKKVSFVITGFSDFAVVQKKEFTDLTGDGVLDISDVRYLTMHLTNSVFFPIPWDSADINSDGKVDIADVRYLTMHITSPTFFPLFPG